MAKKTTKKIDRDKSLRIARFSCGLFFAVLTIFTLVSLISFLFTWDSDQSLLTHPDMMDSVVSADNGGGKIGFLWANFLISKLFGLGAFVIPFFLFFFLLFKRKNCANRRKAL